MKRLLPYIITFAIGAVAVVIIISALGIYDEQSVTVVMGTLSDAFFATGGFLAGIGLLVFASNGGAFYMLGYAVRRFFDLFRRGVKGKYKDFYEYTEDKDKNKHGFAFILIVGLFYIAVAAVFLILYYNL